MDKAKAKNIVPTLFTAVCMSVLSGCVTQSFENNEPIVKTQANRDEMAATRISLGLGYLGMGDMAQAKLNLEKAKRFSPKLVQLHTAFAHYYETVGENKLAIESFEQALSIKADSADTLNNYGVFLCRQGDIAAAEVQFLKAIAVPSYLLVAQSYENLASCYLQGNDFQKAEMYLNKAIFHSPNRTATLLQMVRLQYAMANYKEAKSFLQKFERNTQRFTADSLALAYKLYRKLGQRRTASNYANMLIKMYPQSWESKQFLLNELELIDADNLAKKYQLTQKIKKRHFSTRSNKRVVKLSPKKSANSSFTSSVKATNSSVIASQNKVSKAAEMAPAVVPVVSQEAEIPPSSTSSADIALVVPAAETFEAKSMLAVDNVEEKVTATINGATGNSLSEKLPTNQNTEVALLSTAVDKEAQLDANEPTSTKPIAATRDVPLPEALPEPIEDEVVVEQQVNTVDKQVTVIENIDMQEAIHTVEVGENLYTISVKYNIKISALRKWNNLTEKNKIRIGTKLNVVDPQTVNKIND